MHRFPYVFALALLLTLGGQTAFAAAATATTSAAARAPLDLAALVLFPTDVKARAHASIYGGARSLPSAHLYTGQQAEALAAAGYVGSYESWLVPVSASQADVTYQVATALDEFRTAKGATTGFTIFTTTSRREVAMKTIGAQSRLFILNGADPYDQSKTYQGLTLVVRIDRLVATIYLDDYTGHAPKAAEIEALGRVLAARITAGLAAKQRAPGFSNRVLRFTVDSSLEFQDGYYRLNRKDVSGATFQGASPSFDQLFPGVADVYFSGEYLSSAAGSPVLFAALADFASTSSAATWVTRYLTTQAHRTGGWQQLKVVKDGPTFGAQSHTATFTQPAGHGAPGPTWYGAVIVARVGATAVALVLEAFKPVPVTLVDGLMTTQVRCLKSNGLCPSQKVAATIQRLTVQSGFAPGSQAAGQAAAAAGWTDRRRASGGSAPHVYGDPPSSPALPIPRGARRSPWTCPGSTGSANAAPRGPSPAARSGAASAAWTRVFKVTG